jgi:hypothetical protein
MSWRTGWTPLERGALAVAGGAVREGGLGLGGGSSRVSDHALIVRFVSTIVIRDELIARLAAE